MNVFTCFGNNIEIDCKINENSWLGFYEPSDDGKYRFVYYTKNLVNDKIYIGQRTTSNLDDGYLGSGKLLKQAIRKYGKENFNRRICCFVNSKEDLNEAEKYWIAWWESTKNGGYNIANGGQGGNLGEKVNKLISEKAKGRVFSEEIKRKMSEQRKGKPLKESVLEKFRDGRRKGSGNSMYGRSHKQESINKGRETFKKNYKKENHPLFGKKQSSEHLMKNSLSHRGKWTEERRLRYIQSRKEKGIKSWNFGLHLSDETKNKISDSQKVLSMLTCEVCGFKTKSRGNMNRWHNEKCKYKNQ